MTDIATRPYRVDFGSHSAFVWAWLTRKTYSRDSLPKFLLIAAAIAGISFFQTKAINGPESTVFIGFASLLGGPVVAALIVYALLPLLNWGWQMMIFTFGPVRSHLQSVRLTEDGIEKTVGDDSHLFAWDRFDDVMTSSGILLLFTGYNSAMLVPDSAFATRQDALAFTDAVMARVRRGAHKDPVKNF